MMNASIYSTSHFLWRGDKNMRQKKSSVERLNLTWILLDRKALQNKSYLKMHTQHGNQFL